jgi:hypothetical protein
LGTLDSDDADYYNEQIKHFEENTEDMTNLLKQQLSIIKVALGTFNDTISDMEYNGKIIKEGLFNLKSYMEKVTSETELQLNVLNVKVTTEGHIAQVSNALDTMQRNLDLMIESILNAQKGVLQPQIVSPTLLLETLRKSIPSFPKDTLAPFSLSKDSTNLILRICVVHIYIRNGILGYVISIPLVNRGTFAVLD